MSLFITLYFKLPLIKSQFLSGDNGLKKLKSMFQNDCKKRILTIGISLQITDQKNVYVFISYDKLKKDI